MSDARVYRITQTNVTRLVPPPRAKQQLYRPWHRGSKRRVYLLMYFRPRGYDEYIDIVLVIRCESICLSMSEQVVLGQFPFFYSSVNAQHARAGSWASQLLHVHFKSTNHNH